VTMLWTGQYGVRIAAGVKCISSPKHPDRLKALKLHIVRLPATSFAGVNLLGCEADHSPVLTVEVKMSVA